MDKFRKKPVVIEAIQFNTNNEPDNGLMDYICSLINMGKSEGERHAWHNATEIFIETLEGTMKANANDWIIKGIEGEFYPCKPDIFEKTYEKVKK